MKPDLVWRCRGDAAEVAEGEAIAAGAFTPQAGGALDSLRDLVAGSRIELPAGLPPPAAGVYGTLGYDMIRLAEALPNVNPDPLGLPDAVMIRPSIVAVFDAIAQEIVLVTPARPVKGVSAKDAWDAANARLDAVLADLRAPMTPPVPGEPEEISFSTPVSPEILVRLRDGKVTIRPIAGTRPRGATPEQDLALEQELLADPKERAEHLMLLDLGRNDVGRVSRLREPGRNEPAAARKGPSVRVTESFVIERYSHVMHIVSNVEGDAPEGLDPVDVLMAALPAGTVSGAPKVRAMEIIDELEVEKRGVGYAGAVGYFGADGSVDTCIVLRTGLIKDGMLYVQAGGGIVADSTPDAEYDETIHKSNALRRAASEAWRFG
jgi:anthranilate/para-aminobenzoate synthase component I